MGRVISRARAKQALVLLRVSLLVTGCLWSILTFTVMAQQGGPSTFIYDDDGRLRAVLSPNGDAAVYDYDSAGNFTAIRRLTGNELELLTFTPREGPVGTRVTIFGVGFNQGVSSVAFNGVDAQIVTTSLVSVTVVVPETATTGPISVVTPRGSISTPIPFVVRGIRLSPQTVTLPASDSIQFDLTISGTPTENVIWSVNEIVGGSGSVGTVTSFGSYTAPNFVGGSPVQSIVRATSVDDSAIYGEAVVTIVPFGAGYQFRTDGISVRYGTPAKNLPTYLTGAVSVRYGTGSNNPPTYAYGAVSVRYGTASNNPLTYIRGAVSVRYGTPVNSPSSYVAGATSVSHGPVLTSITPGTISRGTSVALTINGVALNGATRISFFRLANGNLESGITVSNINVNGAATSLTGTITVASNVTTGSYVVVVTTINGSTVRNNVVTNMVQIS